MCVKLCASAVHCAPLSLCVHHVWLVSPGHTITPHEFVFRKRPGRLAAFRQSMFAALCWRRGLLSASVTLRGLFPLLCCPLSLSVCLSLSPKTSKTRLSCCCATILIAGPGRPHTLAVPLLLCAQEAAAEEQFSLATATAAAAAAFFGLWFVRPPVKGASCSSSGRGCGCVGCGACVWRCAVRLCTLLHGASRALSLLGADGERLLLQACLLYGRSHRSLMKMHNARYPQGVPKNPTRPAPH